MENQDKNYKLHNSKSKNKINNFFHEIKTDINNNELKNIQPLTPPPRGKTPIYVRVKNLINGDNINKDNYICTCKKNKNIITSPRSNFDTNNYILYTMPNTTRIIYRNNININNNNNSNNNHLRGSNYTNSSVSGFTSNSQFENLNAKCNYYKNLYDQIKSQNMALLNQIKNGKNNLDNNNDEIDINQVLLKENYILKEEIKRLYNTKSNNDHNNDIINPEDLEKIRDDNDVLNNLVDNLNNKIRELQNEKELLEQNYKNQINELIKQNNNLNEKRPTKEEILERFRKLKNEDNESNEELS